MGGLSAKSKASGTASRPGMHSLRLRGREKIPPFIALLRGCEDVFLQRRENAKTGSAV